MRHWVGVAGLGALASVFGLLGCERPRATTFEGTGFPTRVVPGEGTPDAGRLDAGPLLFTGTFDPPQLVLPPGASGRATVTFPVGAPRTLALQVTGSAAVTPPRATLGACIDTIQDVSCEVTVTTSLETSVGTSWAVELSAPPGLATTMASLGVLMADDPRMSAELVTSFKEAVLRQDGVFGNTTHLAAEGTVAVFNARGTVSQSERWSIWRDDGGWAEEAVFDTDAFSTSGNISRDGTRIAITTRVDGGVFATRVLTRTSVGGWEEEAVIQGIDAVWTLSADGTWLTTATRTSTRVFARDAGTWVELFVGPWSYAAVSDDGSVLATSVPRPPPILTVYRRGRDQWLFEATLVPRLGAWQGGAIWLSADGSTLMLPSPIPPVGSPQTGGEVYVFQRTNGLWSEQAVLRPDPGYVQAQFGWYGQLSADGNRLVVGASAEHLSLADGGGLPNGGVYVFTRHGTSWVRNLRLTSPAGLKGSFFGRSISVSNDGLRFLVGEPGNSTGAPGLNGDLFAPAPHWSGAAFLYRIVGDGS